MDDRQPRRTPRRGRARQRAIRAQAAQAGVPYSVAARQVDLGSLGPGETWASHGRTIYPVGADSYRNRLVAARERRPLDERVRDTRLAAILPSGRAAHLTQRFPPTRGLAGTGVGLLYHGEGRHDSIAMLYLVIAHEAPSVVPAIGELAWMAEMGEETAIDMACAELDRAARRLLERERASLWPRIEAAFAAGERSSEWGTRQDTARLKAIYQVMMTPQDCHDGEPDVAGPPLDGARHILDAVLVVADDGHAPGTRVRMTVPPHRDRTGTIVGAVWGPSGPPTKYEVRPDRTRAVVLAAPGGLVVLAGQELAPGEA